MRVLSVVMALHLFMLPQMLTAQNVVAIFEDCGSQQPTVLEEEVLKHAVDFREQVHLSCTDRLLAPLFHQYEDAMLDHPLLEVPHQPPRS